MPPQSASACRHEAVPFFHFRFDKEPSEKSRRGWRAHRGPTPCSNGSLERAEPRKSLELPSPLSSVERGSVYKRPNQTNNVQSYFVVHPVSKKRIAVFRKFTKPLFHRQAGITRKPRRQSMPENSMPWRQAACAIHTREHVLTFQNMNFRRQSGFPGFCTAWESTPSLPLITTLEMDLSAHSQGNQDCRPFLYMSSSVNSANPQGRRQLRESGRNPVVAAPAASTKLKQIHERNA